MSIFQKLGFQKVLLDKKDRRLASSVKLLLGSQPFNISLYRLAITPSALGEVSSNGFPISNERLEFLGDAVLGSVIADYLFVKYPFRNEGFLTETRSKLVNRETLHAVGIKIGLQNLFKQELDGRPFVTGKSLYGDMLEAFIGAVYLDRGYTFTKKLILERILIHMDVQGAIRTITNFKSKVLEWAQKRSKSVELKTIGVTGNQRYKEFTIQMELDGEEISRGKGPTKKKAEQNACENACKVLEID